MEFDKFNGTKVRKLLNIFYVFGNFNFNIILIVTQVGTNNHLIRVHDKFPIVVSRRDYSSVETVMRA
jgi:hypothetical protein